MIKLFLDAGHGGYDSGATGQGLLEKNVTLDMILRIDNLLRSSYPDVRTKLARDTDTYVSLKERTDMANAWGADYFLSVHINAFDGSASGYEDYIYSGLSSQGLTDRYREHIHNCVLARNHLHDRGMKQANFHVLRESAMPAVLTENGFIDHPEDAALLADPQWRQAVALGHVEGLAAIFSLGEPSLSATSTGTDDPAHAIKTETSSDVLKQEDMHRVIIDGVQKAAFSEDDNVLDAVSRYLPRADTIMIEKIPQ